MTMTQLTYFISIVKCSSMTKVAEQFHVSQPAVSSAIRDLEAEFGVQLFYRVKRELVLTSEGSKFYHSVMPLVEHFNAVQRAGMDLNVNQKKCSIAFAPNVAALYMPDMHQFLTERIPNITIEMHENRVNLMLEMLQSATLDIAFMAHDFPEDSPFKTIKVSSFSLSACISDKLARFPSDSISINDIGDLPLILQWRTTSHNKHVRNKFSSYGITPNVKFEISQISTAAEIIRRGLAVAFLPAQLFANDPSIHTYKVHEFTDLPIYLVYRRHSPEIDTVIRHCLNFFKNP